jgi:O-acetylhomoserine/O-acetylserine sulfhydrylase
MAALEGGVAACATASGTAAVSMTLMALAGVGDNIVASSTVHGGTYHQFKVLAPQLGIECRFVASNEPEDFRALLDDKTKFIFVESISNPKYTVPDFEALADIAHSHGIPLIVCVSVFLNRYILISCDSATTPLAAPGITAVQLITERIS